MTPAQQAIVQAAAEEGIDPSTALAIASRESNFSTTARSSKTIRGMFQMRGDLRQKYGVGDSDDPYVQAKGWARFFKDNKAEMAGVLGRDPTDEEGYLGHHFGGTRAARMLRSDPNTTVDQAFTPDERAQNPHFDKAGTFGRLNTSITSDIAQRRQRFGGDVPDLSSFGELASPAAAGAAPTGADEGDKTSAPDLSKFGEIAGKDQSPAVAAKAAPDFSEWGTLAKPLAPAETKSSGDPMMVSQPVQLGIRG